MVVRDSQVETAAQWRRHVRAASASLPSTDRAGREGEAAVGEHGEAERKEDRKKY